MKPIKLFLLVFVLIIAGCATSSYSERQTSGGLLGAALGGLLGAQFGSGAGQLASVGIGVLVGALVGSDIGQSMDEVDYMRANQAVNRSKSVPLGEEIIWNHPDSGHYGSITPTRDGYTQSGRYCREFFQTITIDGRTEDAHGIACREPDGTWRLLQQ